MPPGSTPPPVVGATAPLQRHLFAHLPLGARLSKGDMERLTGCEGVIGRFGRTDEDMWHL